MDPWFGCFVEDPQAIELITYNILTYLEGRLFSINPS